MIKSQWCYLFMKGGSSLQVPRMDVVWYGVHACVCFGTFIKNVYVSVEYIASKKKSASVSCNFIQKLAMQENAISKLRM